MSSNNDQLELYNDILQLVEEEIHQRRNGESYSGNSGKDEQTKTNRTEQTGGGVDKIYPFVPGKFDAIRNSMNVPLDIAIRGSLARQKLFARENNL